MWTANGFNIEKPKSMNGSALFERIFNRVYMWSTTETSTDKNKLSIQRYAWCPEINCKSDLCRTKTTDDCQLKREQVKHYDSSSSGYRSEFEAFSWLPKKPSSSGSLVILYIQTDEKSETVKFWSLQSSRDITLFELNIFYNLLLLNILYCFNNIMYNNTIIIIWNY